MLSCVGCDPINELQRLAQSKGYTPGEKLHTISLGQGQGPLAQAVIEVAAKQGEACALHMHNLPLQKLLCRLQA